MVGSACGVVSIGLENDDESAVGVQEYAAGGAVTAAGPIAVGRAVVPVDEPGAREPVTAWAVASVAALAVGKGAAGSIGPAPIRLSSAAAR